MSKKRKYTSPVAAATNTPAPLALPAWDIDDTCPGDGNPGFTLNNVLFEALMVKREHGSPEEARFCAWLAMQFNADMIDGAGNLHFDMRGTTGSTTLFTAHSDTVHHSRGAQSPRYDAAKGMLYASDDVLGADDGAGVAILCEMMERGVPGYYIVFRGEECGGIGSSWLADNMPELLGAFKRAVAFDRAGYHDVITHQGGAQCCSDEFADALGTALSSVHDDLMFVPCANGVYTDTKEFIGLIPECTNVSVGYKSQHTSNEQQDIGFLFKLADVCCTIDWEALPTKRTPAPKTSRYGGKAYHADDAWWTGASNASAPLAPFERAWNAARWGEDDDGYDIDHAILAADESLTSLAAGNTATFVELVAGHVFPDYDDGVTTLSDITGAIERALPRTPGALADFAEAASDVLWQYCDVDAWAQDMAAELFSGSFSDV